MARNKHPEVTEARILDSATKLFLEKGYENTTISDIVDDLGDLTRGAVYHHFKSKEEIIEAVAKRVTTGGTGNDMEQFRRAVDAEGTGLDKLRALIRVSTDPNRDSAELNISGQYLQQTAENPRFIMREIENALYEVAPVLQELIELGNRDGSLSVPYPKQAGEVLALLTSLWLNRDIHKQTEEEFIDRVGFLRYLTDSLNMPLMDDEYIEQSRRIFVRLHELLNEFDREFDRKQ